MGSLGFVEDDEFQPGRSNSKRCKLSKKFLDDCGAVNYGSIPKKPRSAIRKRGPESITQHLPISTKPDQFSNGIVILKNGAKKSKLNKKKGRITKDEREVAETLNALADLFSDATKSNKTPLVGESSGTKSSTIPEPDCSNTLTEGDAQQPVVAFEKQSDSLGASGVQLDLSTISRSKVSTFDITPSAERPVTLKKVTASGFVFGMHYYPKEDISSSFYRSHGLARSGELSSKIQGSSPQSSNNRLPSWLENAKRSTQPPVIENSLTADTYPQPQVVAESKTSWKNCSAHVYISRLIKILQTSDNNEGFPEKLSPCGGVEKWPCVSANDQKTGINGRDGVLSFNGSTHSSFETNPNEIRNAILLHKRLIQDQQLPSQSSILCSAKQVQFPPFLPLGQHLESRQQKWTSQLTNASCNHGGRDSFSSLMNYGEALVPPHLQTSKYQQSSPSQQQQSMAMNSPSLQFSNHVKRQHHFQIHHHPLNFQQEKRFFATPTNL